MLEDCEWQVEFPAVIAARKRFFLEKEAKTFAN
jgi:hypothetical protein